jgi:hypothetical protein
MPHYQDGKTLTVYFFKSPSGNEPVRDWLKLRTPEEKKAVYKVSFIGNEKSTFYESGIIETEMMSPSKKSDEKNCRY